MFTFKLEKIIDFKNGKIAPKKLGKIPIYGGNGILGYTDQSNYENILIIGRVGAYCGSVHIEKGKCWVSDNAIAGVHKHIENNEYNYYLLKCISLNKKQIGSSQPLLTQGILNKIDVNIYSDENIRTKIAAVLSALDAKIELNNQINAELEKMAKTIYDYWFVQFDFPDANGKPYKSSGGAMVWNEELKREIPAGWEVLKMNKLLIKNIVKFNFNSNKSIDTIDLSVMPSSTMCLNQKNSSDFFTTNLFILNKFDILFGAIRPYLLKAGFSPFDGLVTGTVHSFKTKNENFYNFALLTMVSNSMFDFAISNCKGTKMPVIGADDLLSYKVAFNEKVAIKFNNFLEFKHLIINNIEQNQTLADLRDWLLPMLMNGQIKVE